MAAIYDSKNIVVWDLTKREFIELREHSNDGRKHHFSIRKAATSPSSEDSGDILVWDLQSKQPDKAIQRLAAHTGPCTGLRFYEKAKRLVSVSYDSTIRTWDLDIDRLIKSSRAIAGRTLSKSERETYGL